MSLSKGGKSAPSYAHSPATSIANTQPDKPRFVEFIGPASRPIAVNVDLITWVSDASTTGDNSPRTYIGLGNAGVHVYENYGRVLAKLGGLAVDRG